jgi:hypothetical protein
MYNEDDLEKFNDKNTVTRFKHFSNRRTPIQALPNNLKSPVDLLGLRTVFFNCIECHLVTLTAD